MSIYPTVRPSLTLDFQKSKQLDPRISFSRSSAATYVEGGVVKYADEHQARFEDEGLLIEESRTNRMVNSTLFTNYNLKSTDVQIVAASGTAPDGTNTATLIHPSGSGTQAGIGLSGVGTNAGSATTSIFAKANGKNWLALYDAYATFAAYFDLANGVKGSKDSNVDDYWIEPVGNGWYKCSVYSSSSSNYIFGVNACDNDDSLNCAPNGTDGVLIWGSQLEVGNFPTSLIPTTGSTVTRAVDIAQITGNNFSSWWNSSEGSIVTVADNFPIGTGNRKAWEFNDGSHVASGPTLVVSGTFFQSPVAGSYTNSTINFSGIKTKTAFTFTTNGFIAGSGDGSDTQTNTSGLDPNVVKVVLGKGRGGYGEMLNGTIARIHYYPTQVSNEQLEAITL